MNIIFSEFNNWFLLKEKYNNKIPKDLLKNLKKLEDTYSFDRVKMCDRDFNESIYILYEGFISKFNRIPKVFFYMIESIESFNVELVPSYFKVKHIKKSLQIEELHPEYQLILGIGFHDHSYDIVKNIKTHNQDLYNFIGGLPPVPFKDDKLTKWIVSHCGKTKNEVIHQVAKYWDKEDFPRNKTLSEMKEYIDRQQVDLEWKSCLEKYPELFSKKFVCNIKDKPYSLGEETVRMLEPNDRMQVLIGVLTVCCQRINSTGEASMLEGLINPDSGFLVFERGSKLLGQSWVWLSKDNTVLVLDNIELADNRTPLDVIHLLRGWLENVEYENIQMGRDFNRIQIGNHVEGNLKWYKQYWDFRYTDAYERVWLKQDGKVYI